ncbi:hypothetical protein [Streptomyces sp. BBFR109]|uniref:hypothetical protein n=1 Tax=Streptomyces sp. BBFR109 TaxID=3448172 RepID=UPI003F77780E
MPPRKRTTPEPQQELAPAVPEGESPQVPDEIGDGQKDAPPAPGGDGDQAGSSERGTSVPAGPQDEQQSPAAPDDEQEPRERSDLQDAERPCGECFPNGWPEGAFSVGCTHGTYIRTTA